MKVSYEPLVSQDIIGNTASAIVDLPMTQVISDDMIKIAAWYDNEYGYSSRLLEMTKYVLEG
jgi:glyceraldehyde 3-phosphate dehydrogenase